MTGRVVMFGSSEHSDVERLLPWLVNGTLEAAECDLAMLHVADCTRCSATLDELRAIQQETCAPLDAAPAPPAFERIRRKVQQERESAARGRSWWRWPWQAWTAIPGWMLGVAAVQCALLLVLVFAALRQAPDAYRLLADKPTMQPVAHAQLVAVFEPGLSQARMQQLLRASGVRIVNGPSDAGAYVLAVPPSRLVAVRDALRAAPGVVMVEELDGADQ